MRIAMALLALALSVSACKKKETKPAEGTAAGSGSAVVATGSGSDSGSGSAAMAGSGSGSDSGSGSAAMAGSGSDSGSGAAAADTAMQKHAGNCPSTVLGATTKAEMKGKAVVVSITSDDKDAIHSIQTRTDELLKERMDKSKGSGDAAGPSGTHDGKGSHGGHIGLCPVHIPEGATAKAEHTKTGVTVTITPKDKPEDLKTEIDGRITKAADWVKTNVKPGDQGNQGGVGGGKGEHGGNHSGEGDGKGKDRKATGSGSATGDNGGGGGAGTGGGGGKGTGGGHGGH